MFRAVLDNDAVCGLQLLGLVKEGMSASLQRAAGIHAAPSQEPNAALDTALERPSLPVRVKRIERRRGCHQKQFSIRRVAIGQATATNSSRVAAASTLADVGAGGWPGRV